MTYYFCIYQGKIGPQTSFLVPIEQKYVYKAQLNDYGLVILKEYEITL